MLGRAMEEEVLQEVAVDPKCHHLLVVVVVFASLAPAPLFYAVASEADQAAGCLLVIMLDIVCSELLNRFG